MPETMEVGVVGVTFEGRQGVLAELWEAQEAGASLAGRLVREPENHYDPNAIAVVLGTTDGMGEPGWTLTRVGYIPKALAAQLVARLGAGETVKMTGARIIRGGEGDRITFGARINIEIHTKEAI